MFLISLAARMHSITLCKMRKQALDVCKYQFIADADAQHYNQESLRLLVYFLLLLPPTLALIPCLLLNFLGSFLLIKFLSLVPFPPSQKPPPFFPMTLFRQKAHVSGRYNCSRLHQPHNMRFANSVRWSLTLSWHLSQANTFWQHENLRGGQHLLRAHR